MIYVQRLFSRAWTMNDEEMMEIWSNGGWGELPLIQAVQWILIVEG